jgi:hypothetical protein
LNHLEITYAGRWSALFNGKDGKPIDLDDIVDEVIRAARELELSTFG